MLEHKRWIILESSEIKDSFGSSTEAHAVARELATKNLGKQYVLFEGEYAFGVEPHVTMTTLYQNYEREDIEPPVLAPDAGTSAEASATGMYAYAEPERPMNAAELSAANSES